MKERKPLKIWLDDVRPPPDDTWEWCKDVQYAKVAIEGHNILKTPITISFDHDLGENTPNGYAFAKYICRTAATGKVFNVVEWEVHSQNPVGAENIRAAMQLYQAYKESWEKPSESSS